MSTVSSLTGSYAYNDTLKGVYYGPGSIKTALPKLLDILGVKRALVLTGRSLFHNTNIIKTVESILKEHDAYGATFYDIGQHSPIAQIKSGAEQFKAVQADVIVTVGGGSPIDAAKAICHFLHQERGGPYARQIAIPTTLSAAEYTFAAAYTDEEGNKIFSISPELAPAGIILDAELTLATPERLWLSTGMRAFDHAVESLYRPLVPPPIKHLCYAALADLYTYLPKSKADPNDVEARQKLQIASWMSLWPLKLETFTSFGLSHVLGHKLGATYSIPHGITSCLTLAPVVSLKAEVGTKEDKEWLANALFYLRKPSTGSAEGDIKALSAEIQRLVDDLGLHSKLSQYNVPRGDIPKIAERAVGSKEDPTFAAVVALLEAIYS
ncbi:alcohol dehydrogenase IV [Lentinus tigrinus ALCF2SS1-6]|uniref:Alcohol dehydrogenase IV n=1 Tax=Lentinus tigrinus ALCF2SS1-6 TaxID=1328759 RepID=A0A5C2SIY5_9APHY|nr:alcohol dehydrogenase IV [Lentinus tigrinus ALCF2SS1-6]